MRNKFKLFTFCLICLSLAGCGQGESNSVNNTVTDTQTLITAELISAKFEDIDLSGDDSLGDKIVLKFDNDVTLIGAPVSFKNTISLPVNGDSFGVNATIETGPSSSEVTITLGAGSNLLLTGTYNSNKTEVNKPSGIKVEQGNIISVSSGEPVFGVADIESTLAPGFIAANELNEARGYHTSTLLNDGRILVVGGLSSNSAFAYTNEIWDTGTWTDTRDLSLGGATGGSMIAQGSNGSRYYIGRYGHTATKLNDGRVLIVGGKGFEGKLDSSGNPEVSDLESAFLYDPVTNTFSQTSSSLNFPRINHYATLLKDGRVLIAGGFNSTVRQTIPYVEVFNPDTSTFTDLNNQMKLPREGGSAHLLPSGDVLFVGGQLFAVTPSNPNISLYIAPNSELYSLIVGGADGPLLTDGPRRNYSYSDFSNGDFYIFGGQNGSDDSDLITRYNSSNDTFESAGYLNSARAYSQASPVANGVIVVGGITTDNTIVAVSSADFYNLETQTSQSYSMLNDRFLHQVVAVNDKEVLVIGGFSGTMSSYSGRDGEAQSSCEFFIVP
ncbi:MAG: hypothetical protein KC493_03555 [Bacteriovoracaceae bacterium]|nr:hypothetical protein [Bacteriovoracaceae bacterium]